MIGGLSEKVRTEGKRLWEQQYTSKNCPIDSITCYTWLHLFFYSRVYLCVERECVREVDVGGNIDSSKADLASRCCYTCLLSKEKNVGVFFILRCVPSSLENLHRLKIPSDCLANMSSRTALSLPIIYSSHSLSHLFPPFSHHHSSSSAPY